jgi:hypothetical protein
MDIRAQAIALLVEKLREIEAEANEAHKKHGERLAIRPIGLTFEDYNDHLDAKNLNYALAYRCEQLVEQIEAALLFEHLDEAEKLAENDELPRPGDRVKVTGNSPHYGDHGTLIAFGPLAHEVLLDKDRNGGSGAVRIFLPEALIWLKPDGPKDVTP